MTDVNESDPASLWAAVLRYYESWRFSFTGARYPNYIKSALMGLEWRAAKPETAHLTFQRETGIGG